MTTALAVHEPQTGAISQTPVRGALLRPVAPMREIIDAKKALDELVRDNLSEGVDFGEIPGSDRRVLFKAGAERVAGWYGCYFRYEIVEREVNHDVSVPWRKRFKLKYDDRASGKKRGEWMETSGESLGLYRYVVRAILIHRATGETVGEGIGVCSTLESKYIDRPRDLENTVVKMAQKRGAVAAALNAFALSDRFTQDVEDMQRDEDEAVETGATVKRDERAEDVDERGVAIVVFGPDTVKGKPIDSPDLSIEFLCSYIVWFLKNAEAAKRFKNANAQLQPEIARRIRSGEFQDDDMLAVLRWIMKNEQRKSTFQWLLDTAAQRRADEEEAALAKQKAESAAGVGIADDIQREPVAP